MTKISKQDWFYLLKIKKRPHINETFLSLDNISCIFFWFWLISHQCCCCDGHLHWHVPGQAIQLQRCWSTPTNPTGRSNICFHIPLSFHALFHCLSVNVCSMLSECLCLMEISFKNLFSPFSTSFHTCNLKLYKHVGCLQMFANIDS